MMRVGRSYCIPLRTAEGGDKRPVKKREGEDERKKGMKGGGRREGGERKIHKKRRTREGREDGMRVCGSGGTGIQGAAESASGDRKSTRLNSSHL